MTPYTKGIWQSEFKRIGNLPDDERKKLLDELDKPTLKILAEANSIITKQSDKNLRFDIYVLSKVVSQGKVKTK